MKINNQGVFETIVFLILYILTTDNYSYTEDSPETDQQSDETYARNLEVIRLDMILINKGTVSQDFNLWLFHQKTPPVPLIIACFGPLQDPPVFFRPDWILSMDGIS